jgi:arsenate reductase
VTVTIWHNPRCSKSRAALALIEARGITPEVRLYLKDTPGMDDILLALGLLDRPAIELVRTGEAAFREAGLSRESSESELIAAMARSPILIERPLVFAGGKGRIGRPPEAILDIL